MAVKTSDRRREPLSRDRVLTAATALADAEGLPAVTMRRLAADLGVEAMSLYHHVPGKDALLDGLVEAVIAEIESDLGQERCTDDADDDADDDWRDDVRRRCLTAREVMLRHPWAPGLVSSRPTIPTAAYLYYEALLSSMVEGGLSYHLGHRALHSLGSMALGFAQEVFSPAGAGGDMDPEQTEAALEAQLAEMAEALPHITAMAASELHDAEDPMLGFCDSQAEFEFTLGLLLDGLARAAARESAGD